MWAHRRREDTSCTSVECYWIKYKLSGVVSILKYITTMVDIACYQIRNHILSFQMKERKKQLRANQIPK